MEQLKKNEKMYYARIFPEVEMYEIEEIVVRTISDTWFVGIDKREKHAYLFSYNDIGNIVFLDRNVALEKVKNAEERNVDLENSMKQMKNEGVI